MNRFRFGLTGPSEYLLTSYSTFSRRKLYEMCAADSSNSLRGLIVGLVTIGLFGSLFCCCCIMAPINKKKALKLKEREQREKALKLKEQEQRENHELEEWKKSRAGGWVRKITTDLSAAVDKELAERTKEMKFFEKGTAALADSVGLPVGDHESTVLDILHKDRIAVENPGLAPASETPTVKIDVSGDVDSMERRNIVAQVVLEFVERELAPSKLAGAVMGIRLTSEPSSETPEYSRFCLVRHPVEVPQDPNRRLTRKELAQRSSLHAASKIYAEHYAYFESLTRKIYAACYDPRPVETPQDPHRRLTRKDRAQRDSLREASFFRQNYAFIESLAQDRAISLAQDRAISRPTGMTNQSKVAPTL